MRFPEPSRGNPVYAIPGFAEAAAPCGAPRPIEFNGVRRLDLRPGERRGVRVHDLVLELEAPQRSPALVMTIAFRGVTCLRIDRTHVGQIFLGLYDVLDWGWEDVAYLVDDFEHGGFELLCRDVEVVSIKPDASHDFTAPAGLIT